MQSIRNEILEVESLLEIPNADPDLTKELKERLKILKLKYIPLGDIS